MIRDIGESLEDVGRTFGNAVTETVGRTVSRVQERRPLPVDLLESDDAYLAVFDAPGVKAGDVQVRFESGSILVRVDRFREFHEGFEMQFPSRGLSLDGFVELPDDADVDVSNATATVEENGTLHVLVPKSDSSGKSDDSELEPEESADAGS